MTFLEMLNATPAALAAHYVSVRELAYNNARIAQHTTGRNTKRLASRMGYLMRQIGMCEAAARRRGISLATLITLAA